MQDWKIRIFAPVSVVACPAHPISAASNAAIQTSHEQTDHYRDPAFFAFRIWAQFPPECGPGQPPADNCSDACVFCNFNGLSSSTAGYGPGSAPNFCGTIENDQWLGFIAGAGSATFTVNAFNCTGGNGVQMALYPACDQDPVPNGCNPGIQGGANNPVSVTVALPPGANYFLLVDRYGGDQCDFTISVQSPAAVQAPPIGNVIGAIQGLSSICPGATVSYSLPPVTNAGAYTWSAPPGWLVNGEPGPFMVLAPSGNSVQITAGTSPGNNYPICVQAANSCFPDGPSTCRTIQVQNLPLTVIPDISIRHEDAPYLLPWGDQADVSGIYQTVL